MKLIDLLVQELPKRGGWPAGAEYAKVTGFGGEKILVDFLFPKAYNKLSYSIGIIACHLIDAGAGVDFHMIRRDSYESALAASQNPAWNGEGVPPVGCECECQFLDAWHVCKVLFVGAEVIVGVIDSSERAFSVNHTKFRPLRTEAERNREKAAEAIDFYMPEFITDTPNELYHAKKIYDAIAAGKIPGVKLDD